MKAEIPEWLLDMSKELNTQDSRMTAHPFVQVRHIDYLPTAEDRGVSHYDVYDSDEGVEICSTKNDNALELLVDYLLDNHEEWCEDEFSDFDLDENPDECIKSEMMHTWRSIENIEMYELPGDIELIPMQEIEKIVSTHFTIKDAERFIARKQHDYPKLYTYVESAYYSNDLRNLQDWIKSLDTHTQSE